MSQKKFKQYHALRMSLSRNKMKKSGILASLLLDVFTASERQLRSPEVYKLGLCSFEKKEFRVWRQNLCDKGWIKFTIENNQLSSVRYEPGHRLLPYLNKEKMDTQEVALINDVQTLEAKHSAELLKITQRLNKLESAVDYIEEKDPPVTKKKIKKYLDGGYNVKIIH